MRFALFEEFEREYQGLYGETLAAFPMVERCFSLEFRNFLGGYQNIAKRNLSRRSDRYAPLEIALRLAAQTKSETEQISIDLPSFDIARDGLAAKFMSQGISPLSERRIFGVRAPRVLRKLATMGPSYSRASKLMAEHGPDALLAEVDLLARLEVELSANFERVLSFIRRNKIRAFLAPGDGKPDQRMLCAAAKELGIPFVVVSHGYVSEPRLISIAPLYADVFVTWTDAQRADLARALPERAADFRYFGFPTKLGALPPPPPSAKNVIMVWEPIILSGLASKHAPRIKEIGAQIRKAGCVPLFRPHPKEAKSPEIAKYIDEAGIAPDTQDLKASLTTAKAIVSSNSSVLTEATYAGRRSYQIEELAGQGYEGAIRVPIAGLGARITMDTSVPEVAGAFDVGRFYEYLQRLIAEGSTGSRRT